MRFIFSFILLVVSNICLAQNASYEEAKTYQNTGYYHEAIKEYKELLVHKKTDSKLAHEIKRELGWCYYEINNYARADFYWTDYLTTKPEDKSVYKVYGIAASAVKNKTLQSFYSKYVKPLNDDELDLIYTKS